MKSDVAHLPRQTPAETRSSSRSPRSFVNAEHTWICEIVDAMEGKLGAEDAYKLYQMAYFAEGPILEIGCSGGKATTIFALAIQAAARGVPLIAVASDAASCETAAANVKRHAPDVAVEFHSGGIAAITKKVAAQPALVYLNVPHAGEPLECCFNYIAESLQDGGLVLIHNDESSANDDGEESEYGEGHGAPNLLEPRRFEFCGRFGRTTLFQKHAAEAAINPAAPAVETDPSAIDTYALTTADAFGPLQTEPPSEAMRDALVTALVQHLRLSEYGLDWNDGRHVIPEIWRLQPNRRFAYFAELAVYDFACRYAEGKRVLHVGGGVGYGSYYMVTRGAREVWSLESDEKAHRYGADRYKHDRIRFIFDTVEALAQKPCEPFDLIMCADASHHPSEHPCALDLVHDLLAPGGMFLRFVPFDDSVCNPCDLRSGERVGVSRNAPTRRFAQQTAFSQIPLQERDATRSQFDFLFEQRDLLDSPDKGAICGLILCQKAPRPLVSERASRPSEVVCFDRAGRESPTSVRLDSISRLATQTTQVSLSDLADYDFLDFGASKGGSIDYAIKHLGGKRGLGIDIRPAKVQAMRESGYACIEGDVTNLALPADSVRFVVMSHFLEHLPDLAAVEKALRSAVHVATDFLAIWGPFFDADEYLKRLGLKFFWSDWPGGHTCHLRISDLHRLFLKLGLTSYEFRVRDEINDSSAPSLHPLDSPSSQHEYDPAVHPPKPPLTLSRPVYREFFCLVWLKPLLYHDDLRKAFRKMKSAVPQIFGYGEHNT